MIHMVGVLDMDIQQFVGDAGKYCQVWNFYEKVVR